MESRCAREFAYAAFAGSLFAWLTLPAPWLLLHGVALPEGHVWYGLNSGYSVLPFILRWTLPLIAAGLLAGAIGPQRPSLCASASLVLTAIWAAGSMGGSYVGTTVPWPSESVVAPGGWTAALWLVSVACVSSAGYAAAALGDRWRRALRDVLIVGVLALLAPDPSHRYGMEHVRTVEGPGGGVAVEGWIEEPLLDLPFHRVVIFGQMAVYGAIGVLAACVFGRRAAAVALAGLVVARLLDPSTGPWTWGPTLRGLAILTGAQAIAAGFGVSLIVLLAAVRARIAHAVEAPAPPSGQP